MSRPFRIELGNQRSDMNVRQSLREATRQGQGAAQGELGAQPGTEMWGLLGEIQSRLDNVKTEISALRTGGSSQRSTSVAKLPDSNQSKHAAELLEVVSATEQATNTILAAAEDVGEVAELLAANEDPSTDEAAEALLNSMVTIYQACNFQDIAGQRISRVIAGLSAIDERMTELLMAWRSGESDEREEDEQGSHLLNGPANKDEDGVVSQNDIDALFG